MSEENKAIVAQVDAAFAAGDLEGFLSLCAEDVEWTMVGEWVGKGKDAIRGWMELMGAEPPLFTATNVLTEGDFVVAQGDMVMKDKDGKTVPYAYCDVYRFRDGKIVELSSYVIKTGAKDVAGDGA